MLNSFSCTPMMVRSWVFFMISPSSRINPKHMLAYLTLINISSSPGCGSRDSIVLLWFGYTMIVPVMLHLFARFPNYSDYILAVCRSITSQNITMSSGGLETEKRVLAR